MLGDIIADSAAAYKPDVVLLMCGTNDLWYRPSTKNKEQGGTAAQVVARINTILDRLYTVVPDATVLLSTISDVNMSKCASYPPGACTVLPVFRQDSALKDVIDSHVCSLDAFAFVWFNAVLLSCSLAFQLTPCPIRPNAEGPPTMPADIINVNNAMPDQIVAPHAAKGRKVQCSCSRRGLCPRKYESCCWIPCRLLLAT
jgi:hypothetical protein